eukprot:535734-Amphidinium_carterae.1
MRDADQGHLNQDQSNHPTESPAPPNDGSKWKRTANWWKPVLTLKRNEDSSNGGLAIVPFGVAWGTLSLI